MLGLPKAHAHPNRKAYYVESSSRTIKLQGIRNVRDLGGIPLRDGRRIKRGLMFRGSALNEATDADLAYLNSELGIQRIIDTRVGWEREAKPDLPVQGAENVFVPYFDKEIVGIDYHRPLDGTLVIGHDFACDPIDFYQTMANPLSAAQMGKVIRLVLDSAATGEPVYFHCSGGKDRVGITSLLILEILGASREQILEDYLLTNDSRDAHLQSVYERFLRLCNGDGERARDITLAHRARKENIDAYYGTVANKYGTMDDFIQNQLGIDSELRTRYLEECTVSSLENIPRRYVR